jgi:hypothetical protein
MTGPRPTRANRSDGAIAKSEQLDWTTLYIAIAIPSHLFSPPSCAC